MTAQTQSAAPAVTDAKKSLGRIIGLDGLRGILALCVIIVHVTSELSPTVLGLTRVDLLGQAIVVFFAMSGFLIYRPFMSRIISGRPQPSVTEYARGRLFRVFPAYIVIFLLANFALHAVFLRGAVISSVPRSDAGTGIITNPIEVLAQLSLQQNYAPNLLQTGINASWTLTVELAFYAVLPLLAFVASKLRGSHPYRAALYPAILLLVVGIVFRVTAAVLAASHPELGELDSEWGPNGIAVLSRSILVWSDTFAFGMIAGVIVAASRNGDLPLIGRMSLRTFGVLVFIAGLVTAALALVFFSRMIPTFIGVAALGLLLLIVLPNRQGISSRLARLLDWLPLRYLGTVSLSIYLWHYPVLVVFTRLHLEGADSFAGAGYNFVCVTAASVALASLTYWFVEYPALRWKPKSLAARGAARTPGEHT
jgi:peptidoglycan/LPS O-acetylase OafA/YrhL